FKAAECARIARFLEAADRRCREVTRTAYPADEIAATMAAPVVRTGRGTAAPRAQVSEPKRTTVKATCSVCASPRLQAKIGSYGPYFKCLSCKKNTAVRVSCSECGAKVYMERAADGFAGACEKCGHEHVVAFLG